MTRLNSPLTFFHKKIVPVIWVGLLVMVYLSPLRPEGPQGAMPFIFGLGPMLVMAALGATLYFFLLKDFVDEVYDAGDALIVRNGGQEERIPLAVIQEVTHHWLVNPPRIRLRLLIPTKFGTEITFLPRLEPLELFQKGKRVANDLKRRVAAAKN